MGEEGAVEGGGVGEEGGLERREDGGRSEE